jgi:hypothetical protein
LARDWLPRANKPEVNEWRAKCQPLRNNGGDLVSVPLERFKKYHSHSARAVFFGFSFVSAQFGFPSPASQLPRDDVRFAQSSQAAAGMRLRQSLAKAQKILAPNGHTIS